ncbi:MAG: pyridoxamine 5'-phosphate oxidase family protein [Rhodohalobacter sp.]|uniref:pyridoxamine 5'-phosphate oxidase family protein n=1 Tax=Rhodohalobacter sp. TaxID=1974210 RepID=UPI0039764403
MSKQFIVTPETTLAEAWERVLARVNEAVSESGHPFRYVTLATVDKTNSPQQRTVVLRDFSDDRIFTIYTDSRSDKVSQILVNDSASLLFYNEEIKLQFRVSGSASVVNAGEEYKRNWDNRGSKSPHSYTSVIPPGTEIKSPKEAYHWHLEGTPNFCLIKIVAERMEFLQLDGVKHIRSEKIVDDKEDTERWISP